MSKRRMEMAVELFAIFRGQVQGVGFRYTAKNLAETHSIKGTVRNLSDGSVELVAQGSQEELERFCSHLEKEFSGYIQESQKNYRSPASIHTSFTIAR
jgi:acylphosphatase